MFPYTAKQSAISGRVVTLSTNSYNYDYSDTVFESSADAFVKEIMFLSLQCRRLNRASER